MEETRLCGEEKIKRPAEGSSRLDKEGREERRTEAVALVEQDNLSYLVTASRVAASSTPDCGSPSLACGRGRCLLDSGSGGSKHTVAIDGGNVEQSEGRPTGLGSGRSSWREEKELRAKEASKVEER